MKTLFKMKLISVIFLLETIVTVAGWSCTSTVKRVFQRAGKSAQLQFSADINNLVAVRQFDVKFYNGTLLAYVRYNPDKSSTGDARIGFSITGDTLGNVVLTIDKVQPLSAGIYIMSSAGGPTKCTTLYILGIPSKPRITGNKTPSVGESYTLQCSSTSSTLPKNHSLSIIYNWRVNNTENPGGTRFSYTSNRNKITISYINKEDASKQFTCTATESIINGYTSSSSDSFSFDVIYGPDLAQLNVSSPYNLTEGDNLIIACTADCFPGCSFTWKNVTSGSEFISRDSILYIGTVDKYMSGVYTCTSKNEDASYLKSFKVVVTVYVRERSLVKLFYVGINFNQTFVTVNEQEKDIRLTCEVSGDPAANVKLMLNGQILKEQTNTNSIVYIKEKASCRDSGVYECEGKSKEMEISRRNVSLFVRCSPRPLRKILENITSLQGTPVTLTFEALANPEPGFSWYKERETRWLQVLSNEDFQISTSGLQTNLTIFRVSKSDFGQYRVKVENNIGFYLQYFYLLQLGQEISKDECKCSNTLAISILLGIISAILSAYAASVTILWRRNSSCKITQSTTEAINSTDKDRPNRSNEKTPYINVAHTSDVDFKHNTRGKASDENVSGNTQYTDLDNFSRERNNMYDSIEMN